MWVPDPHLIFRDVTLPEPDLDSVTNTQGILLKIFSSVEYSMYSAVAK